MTTDLATWIGIGLCLLQSGTFSGLNLALFGVSALRLRIQAATGNEAARKLLRLREDSNFLLTTILWGNVGTNVLLTLLSGSVLTGLSAFAFSTIVITFGGEILPQAYFSRNALRIAGLLSPMLRWYQFLLYPIAKPSALLLDAWLGREGVEYFTEEELREALRLHMLSADSEVSRVEGLGALNFLALDDLLVSQEGEPVEPHSVLSLPVSDGWPVFPEFESSPEDPFLQSIQRSGKKWVIIVTPAGEPSVALDADGFLRAAFFADRSAAPDRYCYRPIIVKDRNTPLGAVLAKLTVQAENLQDDVIDQDVVLLWGDERRVITGADILGRLMRGIARGGRLETKSTRC